MALPKVTVNLAGIRYIEELQPSIDAAIRNLDAATEWDNETGDYVRQNYFEILAENKKRVDAVDAMLERKRREERLARRESAAVEFSDERGRFEGENLSPKDREKLFAVGFTWDKVNRVLFAPSEDIALAGMEVL